MRLHPILALDSVLDEYADYLDTEFRAKDPALKAALEQELDRPGFLAQEPFFQAHRPFRSGRRWRDLPIDPRLAKVMEDRSGKAEAYGHQSGAIDRLLGAEAGPVVVTTGTGSGKSEAFLLPVIQNALADATRFPRPGLTAVLVYPMNALANDQHLRIQAYLESAGLAGVVTVEKYDRGTPQAMREAMRQRPPHILLTNYMMLEYLLVRPADREGIFANHRCRFLALDEVHTYRGTLGANIALLLRRVKAHLARARHDWLPEPPASDRDLRYPKLIPVGTSATIKSVGESVSKEEGRRLRDLAVQEFFGKLAGVEPSSIRVFGEEIEDLTSPDESAYPATPVTDAELGTGDADAVRRGLCRLAGVADAATVDVAVRRCRLLWDLNRWLVGGPKSLSQLVARVEAEVPARRGAQEADVRKEVEAALVLGAALPDGMPGVLRLRAHRFIRGGWKFHRCVMPTCGRLYPMGEERCACGAAAAPLYVCRNCGADYMRLVGDPESGLLTVTGAGTEAEWMVYEPERFRVRADVSEDDEAPDSDDGEGRRGRRPGPKQMKGRPVLDGSFDPATLSFSRDTGALPMRVLLAPARNRCLCCGGLAGSRNVVTPVALGTSAAVKVLAEGLAEALSAAHAGESGHDGKERLLVFSDSRQDAAHQARFIQFASRYDRMRRRVVELLGRHRELNFQRLVEELGNLAFEKKDNPHVRGGQWPTGDERERVRLWEEAPLLDDIAVSAGYRGTLVNLGLVGVVYDRLDEYVRSRGEDVARLLGLKLDGFEHLCRGLLDEMRVRGALSRPMLRFHPASSSCPEVFRFADWERKVSRPCGYAAAGPRRPATRIDAAAVPEGIQLRNSWRAEKGKGRAPAPELIFRALVSHYGGPEPDAESMEAVLEFLATGGYIVNDDPLFGARDKCALFQVNAEVLTLRLLKEAERMRCEVCGAPGAGLPQRAPCTRCHGRLVGWTDAEVGASRSVRRIRAKEVVPLVAREHTAQITHDDRIEAESAFKSGAETSAVNLLACSPTLELGIDVGGLDAVILRNVPPRPDNYAQRGGRAGRRTRIGLVVGYARNTPHDQYFYDHPEQMISGEIPAPALALGNRDVIVRHLAAIAFGAADPGLAGRMADYVSPQGQREQAKVDELVAAVTAQVDHAITLARESFGDDILAEAGLDDAGLRERLEKLPERIRDVVDRTARQVVELRAAIEAFARDLTRQAQAARASDLVARLLGIQTERRQTKSDSDDRSAGYPLRRFAEFGILPGYEFPTEPATLRLLGDPHEDDPIAVARRFGLDQFRPEAQVYARSRRWKVIGLDTSSPWNPKGDGPSFEYRVCARCSLRYVCHHPACPRCDNEQPSPAVPAGEFGGFLAFKSEAPIMDEEDRIAGRALVAGYPQWNGEVVARWSAGPGWGLALSRREDVVWLNEGGLPLESDTGNGRKSLHPEGRGYLLCGPCGRLLTPEPPQETRRSGRTAARAAATNEDRFGHSPVCPNAGASPQPIALASSQSAEILRLVVPVPQGTMPDDVKAWALTLGYALRAGIRHLYMLDGPEIEFAPEGPWSRRIGETEIPVVSLSFIDPSIGGTGYARRIAEEFDRVARAAIDHLDHGDDCETACYRCLKSYQNQRFHELLRWPLAMPYLEALTAAAPTPRRPETGDLDDPRPWLEAFEAGVGSPLELKFLKAFEALGFHPEKQFPISLEPGGRPITIADFAVPESRLAIYIDGAAFHRGANLRRDRAIRSRLRSAAPSWRVEELRASDLGDTASIVARMRAR